jgi:hypothetical protein
LKKLSQFLKLRQLAVEVSQVIVKIRLRSRWLGAGLNAARFSGFPVSPWARAMGVAAVALTFSVASTADVPVKELRWLQPDQRATNLEHFFKLYHCPTPYHTFEYLRAADGYALDYRLLPAVSIRETLCGVTERENNRWGYHPGRQSFPSIEAGIDFVAWQLANNPLYKGKTLHDKLFTYNPRPKYPLEVQKIMQQIE